MTFLASDSGAICVSIQNIEHDTREIKTIVEDTTEKLDQVPVWMRQKVRSLHWNADKSKQQIKAMQKEMQKL